MPTHVHVLPARHFAAALHRLLERGLDHLGAVMPGLPQLGVAMIVLFAAIGASHALAPASDIVAAPDSVDAATADALAGFAEIPF